MRRIYAARNQRVFSRPTSNGRARLSNTINSNTSKRIRAPVRSLVQVRSLRRTGWRLRGFKLRYVFKNTTGHPGGAFGRLWDLLIDMQVPLLRVSSCSSSSSPRRCCRRRHADATPAAAAVATAPAPAPAAPPPLSSLLTVLQIVPGAASRHSFHFARCAGHGKTLQYYTDHAPGATNRPTAHVFWHPRSPCALT